MTHRTNDVCVELEIKQLNDWGAEEFRDIP